MSTAEFLSRVAAELALFAGVGFLLFGLNDLAVDIIYFGRRLWRSLTVYNRYPRSFAADLAAKTRKPGFVAVFVPAWDESAVIAPMLRIATTRRPRRRSRRSTTSGSNLSCSTPTDRRPRRIA